METALANRPHGATILLSHTPWRAEEAAAAGVGLMLSGHTHNGQLWPFTYLVRTRYKLLGGRYPIGSMTAIVCRGTGGWGPRMRLWRPAEILRITLRAKN
jgi:predicted MPP superfamily phosphohydrolase